MNIQRLRVNHIANPIGFDLGNPTFSWEVTGAFGTYAEASRIVVTSAGKDVADTGWADLDNACATIEGLAEQLSSRTRHEWRVSVRTDAGEEATSETAWFETGKMDEPWEASWVTCDSSEPRHPVFCSE
ncbi:MAG: hypothetical protein U0J70_03920, partial [Atopobiaceae bacterium]|nr:hypothetical protein [Atopobiaceae bacterium]